MTKQGQLRSHAPAMSPQQRELMQARMQSALGKSGINEPKSLPVKLLMGQHMREAADRIVSLVASANEAAHASMAAGDDGAAGSSSDAAGSAAVAAQAAARLLAARASLRQSPPDLTDPAAARASLRQSPPDVTDPAAAAVPRVRYEAVGIGLERVTVREAAQFVINAYGADGEKVPIGRVPLIVQVRGVSRVRARVVSGGPEHTSMTIGWKPTCSGQYHIAITMHGLPIAGSPFSPLATDPEPHAPRCVVRGDALSNAISREKNHFDVEFKDKLGVVTHAVDLRRPSHVVYSRL